MSDHQNSRMANSTNDSRPAVLNLDDILPEWERPSGYKGKRLTTVQQREKAANAALREIIQALLDQQAADRWQIDGLTEDYASLQAEKAFTERGAEIMMAELKELRRLKRQFPNIVVVATQIAAAARKCAMNFTVSNDKGPLTVSYQLENGTRVVHVATEEENYQSVQVGSDDKQITLLLGRGTGFVRESRAALKGYFKPDPSRISTR
jgi:hypothetical protein